MVEQWWREIIGAVGVTAVAFWCRKFLATPSRIDRELASLNKTICSMHDQQTTQNDDIVDYMRETREAIARHDERLKALEK